MMREASGGGTTFLGAASASWCPLPRRLVYPDIGLLPRSLSRRVRQPRLTPADNTRFARPNATVRAHAPDGPRLLFTRLGFEREIAATRNDPKRGAPLLRTPRASTNQGMIPTDPTGNQQAPTAARRG